MSSRFSKKAGSVLLLFSSGSGTALEKLPMEPKLVQLERWFTVPGLVIPTEGEQTCTPAFVEGE
jgi:hypothetical protein